MNDALMQETREDEINHDGMPGECSSLDDELTSKYQD